MITATKVKVFDTALAVLAAFSRAAARSGSIYYGIYYINLYPVGILVSAEQEGSTAKNLPRNRLTGSGAVA